MATQPQILARVAEIEVGKGAGGGFEVTFRGNWPASLEPQMKSKTSSLTIPGTVYEFTREGEQHTMTRQFRDSDSCLDAFGRIRSIGPSISDGLLKVAFTKIDETAAALNMKKPVKSVLAF